MNKKYLVLAMVLVVLLSSILAKAAIVPQIQDEIKGESADTKRMLKQAWDVRTFGSGATMAGVSSRHSTNLASAAEQNHNAFHTLASSESLKTFDTLPQTRFKELILKIRGSITTADAVSKSSKDTAKNSADAVKIILESYSFDTAKARSNLDSLLNLVSEQMAQTNTLSVAATYALSMISSPAAAKEQVISAADDFATVRIFLNSALEFSQGLDKDSLVLAYDQLSQASAYINIVSIRYALVYFMLLNDIHDNPEHYENYMYELGAPCSMTTEMPCTGCTPPNFWGNSVCPEKTQPEGNMISAAAVAEPIREFPSFDTTKLQESLKFEQISAEPSFVVILDSNIRSLEIDKSIFLADRGIRIVNDALYFGKTRVSIGTSGVVDYYTGDPVKELSLDDIHTYRQMKFLLEDLLPAIRHVAVIESSKGPKEQHMEAYDKMIKINLGYIDLLDLHERESIWAARIPDTSKEKRLAYANFKTTEAKVNAIESAISNSRLEQALNARPDLSAEIGAAIKQRTPGSNQEILRLLTGNDLLAEYYAWLKQSLAGASR